MSVKGEKYSSKSAMKKHEKTEGPKERAQEYGAKVKTRKAKMVKPKAVKRGK